MNPISPISLSNITPVGGSSSLFGDDSANALNQTSPNDGTPSFTDTLQNAFSQVNDLQNRSDDMSKSFALGQTSDIHSVMIATQQATIALDLAAEIRNKAVDAYQEIMKTSM